MWRFFFRNFSVIISVHFYFLSSQSLVNEGKKYNGWLFTEHWILSFLSLWKRALLKHISLYFLLFIYVTENVFLLKKYYLRGLIKFIKIFIHWWRDFRNNRTKLEIFSMIPLRLVNTQNDFFAALPGALWRLPILGLLSESLNAWNDFSALLLLWLGSFGRHMGTLSAPVCWGLLFTSRCTSPTPPPRGVCWAPKEFFLWVANGALSFSCCLVVGLFTQRLRE